MFDDSDKHYGKYLKQPNEGPPYRPINRLPVTRRSAIPQTRAQMARLGGTLVRRSRSFKDSKSLILVPIERSYTTIGE